MLTLKNLRGFNFHGVTAPSTHIEIAVGCDALGERAFLPYNLWYYFM